MAATEIVKRVYAPSALVGKIYAAPYGSSTALMPIGNVLEASTEQEENVEKQEDMTTLGGGTHAEMRRVVGVTFSAKIADLNVTNLSRAIFGTINPQNTGTVVDAPYTAKLGALIPLPHISISSVVVKNGVATVTAAGNFDVLPEGIWVRADATDIDDNDALTISYTYADQVTIEALTTKAPELTLRFAGLNEADSGKPIIFDLYRVSQGVAAQLTLIQTGFGSLEITGEVLQDPTKTGVGISRYMRTIHV